MKKKIDQEVVADAPVEQVERVVAAPVDTQNAKPVDPSKELVAALVAALQATKPVEKKNPFNRKAQTAWTPKDGSPKLKLKRKMYQHGLLIDPDMETNEVIELLNKLKAGRFLDGWVKVTKRRDAGIDITYPIKTASQRLKLVNGWGIRNFAELLARCIEEAANPTRYNVPDEY